jgi:hypothetical protein
MPAGVEIGIELEDDPSIRSNPAVVSDSILLVAVVYVGAAVVTAPMTSAPV